ncbi:MAG TPA: DUF664 domain-containing protein [Ilumatobacteraceae bacterium]|nr:DUF664 domain-containing protein [Ilumatobacteraceae bacterium]
MSIEALSGANFSAADQPEMNADLREYLETWYRYQRHEFIRKLRDLTPEGIVAWSVPPVELSVLGLVRHMTQMEHIFVSWGLGGGEQATLYGDDDYAGGSVETVDDDLRTYFSEVEKSDSVIAGCASLDTEGLGHGQSLAAVLIKMIDEYALHAGQAHMLRFAALGKMLR